MSILENDLFFQQTIVQTYLSFLYPYYIYIFKKYTYFIKIYIIKAIVLQQLLKLGYSDVVAFSHLRNKSNYTIENTILNLVSCSIRGWNAYFKNYLQKNLSFFVTYFRDFFSAISKQVNFYKIHLNKQFKLTDLEHSLVLKALHMIKSLVSKDSSFILKKRKEFSQVGIHKMGEIQKFEYKYSNFFVISSMYSRRTWFFMRKFFKINLRFQLLYLYRGISKRFFSKFASLSKANYEKRLFKVLFLIEVKKKLKYLVFLFLTWKPNNVFFTFCDIFGKVIYKASGGYWKNSGKSRRLIVHVQKLAQKIGERLVKNLFSFFIVVGLQHIKTRGAKAILRGLSKARLTCLGRILGKNYPTSVLKFKKKRRL